MTRVRLLIAAPGLLLIAFGAYRLVTEVPTEDLQAIGTWLVVLLALHDGVLAPLVVVIGVLLSRLVPPRARRYVQGTAVAGVAVVVIALPLIYREGSQPSVKALLVQDYSTHLALLLAGLAGAGLLLYGVRVVRDRTGHDRISLTKVRPPADQDSATE